MSDLERRALELLEDMEWEGEDCSCPRCGRWHMAGHHVDCELGTLIRDLQATRSLAIEAAAWDTLGEEE